MAPFGYTAVGCFFLFLLLPIISDYSRLFPCFADFFVVYWYHQNMSFSRCSLLFLFPHAKGGCYGVYTTQDCRANAV